MMKSTILQPIRFEHSTCRPYGLTLPFNFRGGDCSFGLLKGENAQMGPKMSREKIMK